MLRAEEKEAPSLPKSQADQAVGFAPNYWNELFVTLLDSFYHDDDSEASAVVAKGLRNIVSSPYFRKHVERNIEDQIMGTFLSNYLAQYTSAVLTDREVLEFGNQMKGLIDRRLAEVFHCDHHVAFLAPGIREARLFALQSAMHRRYPLLASQVSIVFLS